MSLRQRQPRVRDPRYLDLIRNLPCLICLNPAPSEAAHVRYGDPDRGKPMTGLGEKPSDKWTVPLCAEHHRTGKDAQHVSGEREWWQQRGIDPIKVCEALYAGRNDIETAFFVNRFGKAWLW